MRILAGVLILVVAVPNLISGCGYALVGAVVETGAGAAEKESKGQQKTAKTEGEKQSAQQNESTAKDVKLTGTMLKTFGFFLLALAAFEIASGVLLFVGKSAGLILAIGGLEIVAEGIGSYNTGLGVTNILGFVAGILVIVAALQMRKGGGAPAAGAGGGGAPPPEQAPPPGDA